MNKLENILNSKLSVKLTTEETYILASEYTDKVRSKFSKNALFIKNCIVGLENKIIDSDIFLTASITSVGISPIKDERDFNSNLILVALALRYGANPNLYVIYKGVGIVHISVYTVMYLRKNGIDENTILSILAILSLMGSSFSIPCFSISDLEKHKRRRSMKYYREEDERDEEERDEEERDEEEREEDEREEEDREEDERDEEEREVPKTVSQWLTESGLFDFKSKSGTIEFMKSNFSGLASDDVQIQIGAMIDIPSVAFPQGFNRRNIISILDETTDAIYSNSKEEILPGPDLSQIIIYNSVKCLSYLNPTFRYINGETLELKMCLDGISLEAFKFLFDKGYKMTYFQVNRLLILLYSVMKKKASSDSSQSLESRISAIIYMEMLKYAVNKGLRLDLYQLSYLSSFASEFSNEIREIYSHPLWVKACSASDSVPLPNMVKELAMSLNILNPSSQSIFGRGTESGQEKKSENLESSKSEICARLNEVSRMNEEVYINSNKERQRGRMNLEAKGVIRNAKDFESGSSSFKCSNDLPLNGDPLDYSDDSLVYYTDENNKIWCFTPNIYEDLIKSGVNIYTNKPIPRKVVIKMKNVLKFMDSLNIDPKKIVRVSNAVDRLNAADMISNEHTDISINFVEATAAARGILPQQLKDLSPRRIYEVMKYIGFDIDYIRYHFISNDAEYGAVCFGKLGEQNSLCHTHLPHSLIYATFCKAIYIFFKKYDDVFRMSNSIPSIDDVYSFIMS